MKNKSKSSSGSVKAPLTYDPGKGRPKEYLAYLNYQEMQALKRLNGNNMERGPRGLPSFPPADAIGSSSRTSSTKKSGPSSSLNAPARTAPSASRTTTRGPAASMAAARQGSSISKGNVGTVRQGSPVSKNPAGGGARDSGRATASTDRAFKQAAEQKRTSKALSNPALKQDAGRSAIGGISRDKSVGLSDGRQISGAIGQIKRQATQPRDLQGPIPASVSTEQYGWSGTGPNKLAAYQGAGIYATRVSEPITQAQVDTLLSVNTSYDPNLRSAVFSLSPEQRRAAAAAASAAKLQGLDVKTSLETLAAESGFGKAPSRAGSQYQGIMQIGTKEFDKYADPVSKKLGRQDPFANAQAGTAYLKDISSRIGKKLGRTPTSGETYSAYQQGVTGFNRLLSNPDKPAKDVVGLSKVRSNLKGVDKPLASTMTSREFLNYISQFPSEKFKEHTATSIVPTSAPPGRSAVPGLIQYPRLDRPTPPTAAQEAARLRGLMEPYQQPPGYGKLIVDRVPTYDGGPAKSFTMSPDVQGPFRPKLYTDRIMPEFGRLPEDPTMQGRTVVPSAEQGLYRGALPMGMSMTPGLPTQASYFRDISDISSPTPSRSYFGDVPDRVITTPSRSYFEGVSNREVTTPSRSYFGDITSTGDLRETNVVPSPGQSLYRGSLPSGMSFAPGLERMAPSEDLTPAAQAPTAEMIEAMRASGPFVTLADDPENLRYRAAADVMRLLPGGYPEVIREVEEVPEETQYNRAETEETISPFGPRSYDVPYPTDEYGNPVQEVSESDLAKIRARRRGEEYAPTPKERNAIRAGKILTSVITGRIPGLSKIINTEAKMKDFYSRPSWEQEYIAQRASDWAAIRGERPVTKAEAEEIKERTGRNVPRKPGGISDLGRGSDRTYEKIVSEIPKDSDSETSSPSSGQRPEIYYMWDLGVNIPSPGDPNYTQYQTYLAERLAAQQAMGFV